MTLLVMSFALIVGVVVQATAPTLASLGHAPLPVLLGMVIYYALLRRRSVMLTAAVLAGLMEDCLGQMPLGYTSFFYCVVGLVCESFREIVVVRQWTTHVFFGAAANAGVAMACFVLLGKDGLIPLHPTWFIWRVTGAILLGSIVVPVVFSLMELLDRTVGNVEWKEADSFE